MATIIDSGGATIQPIDPTIDPTKEPWCPGCLSGIGPTDPKDPYVDVAYPVEGADDGTLVRAG